MVSIGPLDFGITIGIIVIIYGVLLHKNKDALERSDIGIIVTIGATGLLFRLISFFLSTTHDPDTTAFVRRSKMVLSGMISFKDFTDPKPLWTHTLAAWFYVFGISVENLFLLLITVDVSMILFMFFVAKDVLGKKEGYIASMFYAFNPFTIIFSSAEGKMDMIPVLFALLAFWFLKKGNFDLSAVLLGVGITYKYLAGLYLIPFLFIIKKSGKQMNLVIKYIAECAAVCGLIMLPFFLISPSDFIRDTFLFFVEEKITTLHELHLYNFVPFYIPLIFVWITWIVIISLGVSIDNIEKKDELRVLFFFIIFTVLLNRVVYSHYFTYTIPILCLMFAQGIIKNTGDRLSISWREIVICLIPFLVSLELLNNFGLGTPPFRTADFISDLDIYTYFGIAISTLMLFIDWIITLRSENRLKRPNLLLKNLFNRF